METSEYRFLFASVDAPPKTGGVANLSVNLARELTRSKQTKEGVFVGPSGTHFADYDINFKVIEDFNSDTRLRAEDFCELEDSRIEDLFSRLIEGYNLNQLMLFHPFYFGMGGIHAAHRNKIAANLYLHGTELTSQIPELIDTTEEVDLNRSDPNNSLRTRLIETVRNADRLFTNSHFSKELIAKLAPETPITVTGCGIDRNFFKAETSSGVESLVFEKTMKREKLGLPPGPMFVSVGRLVPHKNTDLSIRLMAEMSDAQLFIIGSGPEEENLRKLAFELGVSDRVNFLGSIDEGRKWKYLRAADVGILASGFSEETGGYEGFGIVMLEYTAAGCLTLTPGRHGMYDFAKRFEAGIIGLESEETLSETASMLQALLADQEEVQTRVEHARKVVEHRYTWQEVSNVMIEALNEG